jgi:hypothetical protein
MKKLFHIISLLVVATMLLTACGPAATPTAAPTAVPPTNTAVPPMDTAVPPTNTAVPPTETLAPPTDTPVPAWMAPEGSALVAVSVDAAPTLDGVADEAFWADAPELVIPVAGGFGGFGVDAKLKAVYTEDSVYFVLTYADPTQSWYRSPWQKQEDGTWKQIKDPDDKGGDNNLFYEDKFAMIWPINNSIKNFETAGCFTACHAGENSDIKPYGNKYTAAEGETGDIWHWKSVRNLGQIDDQFLDWTKFDAEKAKEAGRKSDPKESGGYADNFASMPDPKDATKTVADKTKPGFTSPSVDLTTGAPGYILDSEKVALTQEDLDAMPVGTLLPGIVKSAIVGDRGDIAAAWEWKDGVWTIEFGRKLVTTSETDVEFSDLTAMYYFGLAIFENAQVRHAIESGVSFLVFQPKP